MTFWAGSRPMTDRDSTVLPEPDSPTMPMVWPRSTVNETPSTARTVPRSVRNQVARSCTSSSGPPAWPSGRGPGILDDQLVVGRAPPHSAPSLTSKKDRRLSPAKLKASTVMNMAAAGISEM